MIPRVPPTRKTKSTPTSFSRLLPVSRLPTRRWARGRAARCPGGLGPRPCQRRRAACGPPRYSGSAGASDQVVASSSCFARSCRGLRATRARDGVLAQRVRVRGILFLELEALTVREAVHEALLRRGLVLAGGGEHPQVLRLLGGGRLRERDVLG